MKISHLNGWRAVEAVLRLGSITSASEELGVTPAAVGAQVRGIEDLIGKPLFDRASAGLKPLPVLLDVRDRLNSGFTDLAEVQKTLSARGPSNRLALSVTQTFAETWLPRHLPDLFARMSGVDLRLDTTWDVVDLQGGDLDFAIRYTDVAPPGHLAIPLLPTGVVPVCTPDFAKRYDLNPATRDLRAVPLVFIDVPTSDPDWADWGQWSGITGIPLGPDSADRPRYELTGSGARIARSGVGLVLGGLSEVFQAVHEGALIMPLGPSSLVRSGYCHQLVWPEDRKLGPMQRQFRDWVTEKAREDREIMDALFGVRLN